MRAKQILALRVRVDLGVMAMKEYCILPKSPELESHHQIKTYPEHSFLARVGSVLALCRGYSQRL